VSPLVRRRERLVAAAVILPVDVLAVVLYSRLTGPSYFSRHNDLLAVAFPDVSHAWVVAA
jgi:hypothetical protein